MILFFVKLSNSHLNKLESGTENGTEVTLNLSSNLIGNFIDQTNFLHKLLLINFANGSSANINFV